MYLVPVSTRNVFFVTLMFLPFNEDTSLIRLRKRSPTNIVYWPILDKLNSATMSTSVISVISRFLEEYTTSTPNKLKMVDAYLLYILLTGALQFLYCLLVGTFPFNSFLSGFISCVGSFILAGKYLFCQMLLWLVMNCTVRQLEVSSQLLKLWSIREHVCRHKLANQAKNPTT